VKAKDLVEVGLLYVGIPAATLYPLGFAGLFVQLWSDGFFPYYDFNTIWDAVARVPQTAVVGTGIRLLYLSLIAALVGLGVAPLISNVLGKRHASEAKPGTRRGLLSLYMFALVPMAAFMIYNTVHITSRRDVLFLAGFVVLSTVGGVLIGYIRARGRDEWFFLGLVGAYLAAVFAALCIAAVGTPSLPLVEINTPPGAAIHECSELQKDRTFVKVSSDGEVFHLYNETGFFALHLHQIEPVRYHPDCPSLR
jgi:peptidoglycan/LPS O-acetylase OafA/YrhL